jgi:hypothetical protein
MLASAYHLWSEKDDKRLHALMMAGCTVTAAAEQFKRTPGAIRSRLKMTFAKADTAEAKLSVPAKRP